MKLLERKYTVEDYEKLPEGSPYQLIEGELVISPAPIPYHQMVLGNIYSILRRELKRKGLVLFSPVDVYLDERNAYQPDLVVLLKNSKAKLTAKGIYGAPELVVEVLSPSNAYYDLRIKKEVYEKYGVKEYWIADPLKKSLEIYTNREGRFELLVEAKEEGKILSPLLGVELELSEVFEGVEL
ncbi:MAG: Uma2 family endonuclease [Hydrogenobacter sp.]